MMIQIGLNKPQQTIGGVAEYDVHNPLEGSRHPMQAKRKNPFTASGHWQYRRPFLAWHPVQEQPANSLRAGFWDPVWLPLGHHPQRGFDLLMLQLCEAQHRGKNNSVMSCRAGVKPSLLLTRACSDDEKGDEGCLSRFFRGLSLAFLTGSADGQDLSVHARPDKSIPQFLQGIPGPKCPPSG